MEEILNIILRAVDDASEVFHGIAGSAEDMADDIKTSAGMTTSEFEEMENNVSSFQDALSNVDDQTIQELAEDLGMTTEEVEELIQVGMDIGSIPFDDAAASAREYTSEMEEASKATDDSKESGDGFADSLTNLASILEGIGAAEVFDKLADGLMDCADKAGTFEDSLMRARLEAEGAGIDVNDMTDAVSELSSTTGRAGSEIRESFINATARGITDMDSFKSMMEGAGAQATLFGTDIQSMADKMSGLAMRSSVMEKTLTNTGITVEELGEALGIQGATIDDINEKWATLDTNQKAAALGMAASMNEGQNANEEYKKSWAGLQAQLDIAKGRIERLVGEVLLPVLIPALELAASILQGVGDVVEGLINGPFGGLISVIGSVAAAFALAVPAFIAVSSAYDFITASAFAASAAELAALWPIALIGAALAVVAYAVYEVGKAFGWWKDTSSMLDAIWAGVQRLWSAFINHPDVQGFLSALKSAWAALQPVIQGVISWVMSFFTNTDGGKFDAVRSFIEVVGKAWQAMTLPIRTVITVVKLLMSAIKQWYTTTKRNVDNVRAVFRALPGMIRSAISSLVNIITKPFRDAYKGVTGAVNRIKSYTRTLTNINLSSITNKIVQPFRKAYSRVVSEVDKIKAKANSLTGGALSALGFNAGFDIEGIMEELQKSSSPNVYSTGSEELTLDHNINFRFDFTGLPEGTSEETLVRMLQSAITDKSVINQLVNSPDFQSLDSKVKNRILLKNGRARGV